MMVSALDLRDGGLAEDPQPFLGGTRQVQRQSLEELDGCFIHFGGPLRGVLLRWGLVWAVYGAFFGAAGCMAGGSLGLHEQRAEVTGLPGLVFVLQQYWNAMEYYGIPRNNVEHCMLSKRGG